MRTINLYPSGGQLGLETSVSDRLTCNHQQDQIKGMSSSNLNMIIYGKYKRSMNIYLNT
jgi:ethanolamine ammonia-lyase large subunit